MPGAAAPRPDPLLLTAALLPSLAGLALSFGAYRWIRTNPEGASDYVTQLKFVLWTVVLQGLTSIPYATVRLWLLGRTLRAYRLAALATLALGAISLGLAALWGHRL